MNKKAMVLLTTCILGLVVVFVANVVYSPNGLHQGMIPVARALSNYYLPYGNGSDSKIFVLSAYASYGYYPFATRYSLQNGSVPVVTEGEPCIIISSTIRNDYPTSMWTFLTGQLFNGETQINTTDLTQVGLFPNCLTFANLNSGESATLSIYLSANNWNMTSFKIVLVYVGEIPPP